ncbi:MAG: hypothetical protein ACK4ND_12705 [Cytophagaceae bacterium]
MIRKLVFIAFVLIGTNHVLNAQTVYFNGLGRALVTNDKIAGLALDPDTVGAQTDNTNPRRGTGGYTIFDLGVNAQPNEMLRAHALLRIQNEFGGFYGDGSFLLFRQMRLDGVLGKLVKYEIGDLDLALTPYTLYNFEEMYNDFEADIFAIRRSVVHYENFNFGNKWRVQGFNTSAAFQYEKGIERLGFRAFATRPRRTDFLATPDRIFMGGRVDVKQSKFFNVGINYANFFDVMSTVATEIVNYNNKVYTADVAGTYELEKLKFQLLGEAGMSDYRFDTMDVEVRRNENNIFYDLGLSGEYKPLKARLTVSYREVQPMFSSPGAQTRRINDFAQANLFPTMGNAPLTMDRRAILMDRISQEHGIRNLTLQPMLMPFLPQYNNITPFGMATPNRRGVTVTANGGGDEELIRTSATIDLLSEVQGEGVASLREFTGIRGGFVLNAHKLLGWESIIAINAGIRHESTTRELSPINLQSTLYDAGLTVEVLKGLDLIGGYKLLTARGNEFLAVYVMDGAFIDDYMEINIDTKEHILAFGGRYRFSKNSYFTLQGHFAGFTNNENRFNNYTMNQAFLNYTMLF